MEAGERVGKRRKAKYDLKRRESSQEPADTLRFMITSRIKINAQGFLAPLTKTAKRG
jgi:hypothetical protein